MWSMPCKPVVAAQDGLLHDVELFVVGRPVRCIDLVHGWWFRLGGRGATSIAGTARRPVGSYVHHSSRHEQVPISGTIERWYSGRSLGASVAVGFWVRGRSLRNEGYNARPQWLGDAHVAHVALDAAMAAAYGSLADISDEDALHELLALTGGGR